VALNGALGKSISTAPESVAPENPQQQAKVENFGAGAQPAAASTGLTR